MLLGNGSGGFGAATNFGFGADPISVAVGDFDGDTDQDLATANFNSSNISILLQVNPVGYARPKGASPANVRLVPAFDACTEPANGTHGAPLDVPSCNPPTQSSPFLTFNADDRPAPYDTGALGSASLTMKVTCVSSIEPPVENGDIPPCNANTGDQVDVKFTSAVSDVRCVGVSGGCSAAGGTFAGKLLGLVTLRITDRLNSTAFQEAGTVTDYPFAWGLQCSDGGCSSTTSADAVIPGLVNERRRAIWELGQIQVLDGGSDGDLVAAPSPGSGACPPACAGNGGETVFLRQGLFAP